MIAICLGIVISKEIIKAGPPSYAPKSSPVEEATAASFR
jgi:hypothetical protein